MKTEWKPLTIRAAIIVLATLFVYIPAMQSGFIWDDNLLITQSPVMQSPDALRVFWWFPDALKNRVSDFYPLTWTTLWLDWRIWGENAAGYHVANVLMHALGAVLVWRVLRRLAVPGAFLAGLIFAVHPVNVASVAWITERKNTLSIIFYLLTVIFYLRFDDTSRRRWYALSLAMFVLALLSKTSVVTTPVVLLLCLWWRKGRLRWKELAATAPFFALAAGLALLTIKFQTENAIHGEVVRQAHEKLPWRLALAGTAPWFYLYKALVPHDLLMIYPRWNIDPARVISYLPGLALIGSLAVAWRFRKSWGRPVLFAMVYFLVTLLPVLGFFDMYYMTHSLVADHWQYVSIIAVIALVVAAGIRLLKRWRRAGRIVGPAAAIVVVCVLAVLTWNLTLVYDSQITLWEYNLAINPNAWMGQYNLGTSYGEQALATQDKEENEKLLHKAMDHLRQAIRVNPNYSAAHNNLGLTLMHAGNLEEATAQFHQAIALDPNNANAYNNLGLALVRGGKEQEAIPQFLKASDLAPYFTDPVFRLGLLLAGHGRTDEAIHYLTRTLAIDPSHCDAYYMRGMEYFKSGRSAEAAADFTRAVSLRPDFAAAHYQLGLIAQAQGKFDEARYYYVQTLLGQPGFLEARYRLGVALARLNRLGEAIATMTTVVRAKPNFAEAQGDLGSLLVQAGQPLQAVGCYRKALELKPGWVEVMNALAGILATTGEPNAANIQEAVQLAEKAAQLTNYSQPNALETLAAAYAEAGRFDSAVQTQQKALDLLGQSADMKTIEAATSRLQLYKAGRTLRQGPAGVEGPTPPNPKQT